MPTRKDSGPAWTDVKRELRSWDRTAIIELLGKVFGHSAENRLLIASRVLGVTAGRVSLEQLRRRIREAFYGRGKWPGRPPQLAAARKMIRDYRKATGDAEGTLDLLMTFAEVGTQFTLNFGDIDGPFYDSLCDALTEVEKMLRADAGDRRHEEIRERLRSVAEAAGDVGCGYGDFVRDMVSGLK